MLDEPGIPVQRASGTRHPATWLPALKEGLGGAHNSESLMQVRKRLAHTCLTGPFSLSCIIKRERTHPVIET